MGGPNPSQQEFILQGTRGSRAVAILRQDKGVCTPPTQGSNPKQFTSPNSYPAGGRFSPPISLISETTQCKTWKGMVELSSPTAEFYIRERNTREANYFG